MLNKSGNDQVLLILIFIFYIVIFFLLSGDSGPRPIILRTRLAHILFWCKAFFPRWIESMSTIALTPVFYIVIILPFLTDIYATKNMEITKLL